MAKYPQIAALREYLKTIGPNALVSKGAQGKVVLLISLALEEQHFGASPKNEKVASKFGSLLEHRVKQFQGAHGLVEDGKVGPKTFATLTTDPKMPAKPGPNSKGVLARRVRALDDHSLLEKCIRQGRAFTGGANACAASQNYFSRATRDGSEGEPIEAGAQRYADRMEHKYGWKRGIDASKVKKGFLLVSKSRNSRPGADHVMTAMSDAYQRNGCWYVKCFDNRPFNRPIGYERNLSCEGKAVPMAYYLEPPT